MRQDRPSTNAELRRRAEDRLQNRAKPADDSRSEHDAQRLLHELQVHQIELEMQNEELRNSQAKLQEAMDIYAELYDFAPVGYFTLERSGAITRTNLTGARLLGIERSRLSSQRFGKFVATADLSVFNDFLQRVFAAEANQSCELKLVLKEQPFRTVQIEATLSRDGIECRAVVLDITERSRVEDELNRKNREIERLIYTVSHDLRSPLETVKTSLGHLGRDLSAANNERIADDIKFMQSATGTMEALLNELLEMGRLGRAIIPHEAVTFRELATEAMSAVAGKINAGKVDVQVIDDGLVLQGDRRRLLQIWQNLLDNAVKFIGDQTAPFIEIGVEDQQGDSVFYICDNGIGIDPEYHEKVFGMFEQMDRNSGGIGMGLSMVRHIVELYGGRIRVESAGKGQGGSCFRFTLPLALKRG